MSKQVQIICNRLSRFQMKLLIRNILFVAQLEEEREVTARLSTSLELERRKLESLEQKSKVYFLVLQSFKKAFSVLYFKVFIFFFHCLDNFNFLAQTSIIDTHILFLREQVERKMVPVGGLPLSLKRLERVRAG